MITIEDLQAICTHAPVDRLQLFLDPLNAGMKEYEIDANPEREAAFLAQVAHESGEFRYVRELASGAAYEGRRDLGNTEPGDGVKYRGRGLIQITGRDNYRRLGGDFGIDLLGEPWLLETPALAARSACWFWAGHGLNEMADKGDFMGITRRINGGYNGLSERMAYHRLAQQALA